MIASVVSRDENWGRVVYHPGSDEFEGHVFDEASNVCIGRPISAGCLVTGRCDLKCAFCYGNDEALPKEDIAVEEWRKIFEHMRAWGLMRVDLSGGEPTLRHDLPQIAQAAVDAGLNVVISTNGRRLCEKGPVEFPRIRWHVSMDSGFAEIHESSRLLRSLKASEGSFERTSKFIRKCLQEDLTVRVMTCLGHHNVDGLFALGEHLALLGVGEWNISRILRAGRAQPSYSEYFSVSEDYVLEQIHDLREAFPFMRIRYSNRTNQDGYFLLVLPDGSLATQYTDGRDKVVLGKVLQIELNALQNHPDFNLDKHGRKWIFANLGWQSVELLPTSGLLQPTSPLAS
jgi:MoaA/NifB/PqqE/SkfB family radical SAM enzyme